MDQQLIDAFSLDGRVAVVTGAARGIGAQAAVTFGSIDPAANSSPWRSSTTSGCAAWIAT